MKILQIIFSLSSGGAEKMTCDLCNELVNKHEVTLCVIQDDQDKNFSFFKTVLNEKVQYINLKCRRGINIRTFINIFKLINHIKPDIIHAHLNTILYLYLPALIYKNDIKFIHTIHTMPPKSIGFKWQKLINSFFYKHNLIRAVVISDECKYSFYDFFGHKNTKLIHNGVSQPIISNKSIEVINEIGSYKRNPNTKVFIHIGSFSPAKNHNLLIDVFNRLIVEKFDLILIIIGKQFEEQSAEKLIKRSKPNIFYLGTKQNIADYLLVSDSFVMSSIWEGMPMSLLEAISFGVIPVCTPAGGIQSIIKNESIGFLANDFSEEGLYSAVVKCLDLMERFDRNNLKNFYSSNFSMVECANKYTELYRIGK